MSDSNSRLAGLVLAAALAAACGSSSSTLTGPAPVKCSVEVSLGSTSVGPGGGKDTAMVTAARECAWSAAPGTSWISIASGRSGQGDGTIDYVVAANASPRPRTGSIVVNDLPSELTQEGAPCTFALDHASTTAGSAGGSDHVAVSAPAGCAWTATSQAAWLTVVTGAIGAGPGTVDILVAANASTAPRSGEVTIAGHAFSVHQVGTLQSCGVTLSPSSVTLPAAGGSAAVSLTTGVGCAWTASPGAAWLSATPASGAGSGIVDVAASANPTPSGRVGTVTIGGAVLTIDQSGSGVSCVNTIQPPAASVPSLGGTVSVSVQAPAGCAWSATSHATWITVISGQSGTGHGTVQMSVVPYLGLTARVGTVSIAGHTLTVTQSGLLGATLETGAPLVDPLAALR